MSEHQQPAGEQAPAPPRIIDGGKGTIYATVCPKCGRQVAERKLGPAVCRCGAAVELKVEG